MRIAQLANFVGPSSGGMKTALDTLGRGYREAGADRLLIVPGPRDQRLRTTAGEVVQLRAPRVGGGYRLLVEPWRALRVLEEFAPTSVEVSDKSTLLPVTQWARRCGVGSVLFSHERLDSMVALRTGLNTGVSGPVSLLNRLLVHQYDAVVVTSSFARGEFTAYADAGGTPLYQVALGVDLDTFRPRRRADRTARTGDDALRLVHVGRLSREKSPQLAVSTAVALHRRGIRVRLDVYGTGPQRHALEELAGDAPVVFHGHLAGRDQLAERLAAADVALSVCPGETFGLAVLEALACGTPVVSADVGGARELVESASGAWGRPEPEALADAVLRVAARPEAASRAAARRRAEQFPWSRTVAAMLALHAVAGARAADLGRPA